MPEEEPEKRPTVVSGLDPEWDWLQKKVSSTQRLSQLDMNKTVDQLINAKDSKISESSVEETEPYDPFQFRDNSVATGNLGAFMNVVKSSLAAGILSMPLAFKNGGIWFSLVGTLLISALCLHCCYVLVNVSRRQCVISRVPKLDYGETAAHTFLNGPKKIREHYKSAKFIVNFFLCVTYFGTSCVYAVLMGNQLKQILECTNSYKGELNVALYILMGIPVLVLLAQFRDLKHLVPISFLANFCFLAAISIVFYYIFRTAMPDIKDRPFFGKLETFPSYVSIVVFSLQNIGVIMPVENNLKHPKDYLGYGILFRGYAVITALYIMVGFFGYWKYGAKTEDTITLNTPFGESTSLALKSLIIVAITLSFALAFFIASSIILNLIRDGLIRKFGDKSSELAETMIRISFVILIVIFSMFVPRISSIIGLVSAIGFTMTGILFPIIFDLFTFPIGEGFWEKFRQIKNYFIIAICILILVFGTYTSILELLEFDRDKATCPCTEDNPLACS